jgi:hypothetical protein
VQPHHNEPFGRLAVALDRKFEAHALAFEVRRGPDELKKPLALARWLTPEVFGGIRPRIDFRTNFLQTRENRSKLFFVGVQTQLDEILLEMHSGEVW